MLRREFSGAVVSTTLAANINSSVTSFSVLDGSTFPDGLTNPFVVVVDRGVSEEEKVLCLSRSSNTFTVLQRGYDGTVAQSHNTNAIVDHVLDAKTIQDMNTTTFDNQVLLWMGV